MRSTIPIFFLSLLSSLISALPASSSCIRSLTDPTTLSTPFTLQALIPSTLDTWDVYLRSSNDLGGVSNSLFISKTTTLSQTIFSLTEGNLTTIGADGSTTHAWSPPESAITTAQLFLIVFNVPIPDQYLPFSAGYSSDSAGQPYLELKGLPPGVQIRQLVVESVTEGQTIYEKPGDFDDASSATTPITLKINFVSQPKIRSRENACF